MAKGKEITRSLAYPLLADPLDFYVEPNIFRNRLQHLKNKSTMNGPPQHRRAAEH